MKYAILYTNKIYMSNTIQEKDKKLSTEIIRFLITGCICARLDFLVCYLLNALLKDVIAIEPLLVGIYTLGGFLVGVTANYVLSNLWVFKNVNETNKKEQKTPKFILLFVLLSAGGWAISFITMYLCTIIFDSALHININDFSLVDIFNFKTWATLAFWLFVLSFILKTFLGMVWNYLTRKFILYKAPKEDVVNE